VKALALVLLLGCGSKERPRREHRRTEVATESAPAKKSFTPSSAAPATPGPVPGCQGTSIDPPSQVIDRAGELFQGGEPIKAVNMMHELAKAHPQSATVRAKLGALLVHTNPPHLDQAIPSFEDALRLHDDGCRLSEEDEFQTLNALTNAYMDKGEFAPAVPWLRRAIVRWPASGTMHYNLACALCMTHDREGCMRELTVSLEASNGPPPPLLEGRAPPAWHYAKLAADDPDLASVRGDPRFRALVARFPEPATPPQ